MVLINSKKSIIVTLNDNGDLNIDYVFIIKNIDVDKITVDKFEVDCRDEIENAWDNSGSLRKNMIVKLTDKMATMTLIAHPKAIEKAVENLGLIVKDVIIVRPPKAKKVRISDIELFHTL